MSTALRLLAEEPADLEVISAALQDAIARIGDISYEAQARRLTVAFNRFRWEAKGPRRGDAGERVRAGLQISGVMGVQARRLRRDAKDAVVSLMSVTFEPGEAPGGVIALTFAGGGDLRAQVECIDAVLADISEAWPTPRRPGHD